MAKRSVRAPTRRIDLEPIIEQLSEALCIVELAIDSLDGRHRGAGPEAPALQCALRGLNNVHSHLSQLPPR